MVRQFRRFVLIWTAFLAVLAGPDDPIIVPDPVLLDLFTNGNWYVFIYPRWFSHAFDENGDGVTTEAEALLVNDYIRIQVPAEDLTGLHYFANLRRIIIGETQLTHVGLDTNPLLDRVVVYNNDALTTIDLLGLPLLTEFQCSDNATLATVNLDYFSQIRSMAIRDNPLLTHLDIANQPNLETLHCFNNGLLTLSLMGSTALRSMSCQQNNLTEIDLSEKPSLTWVNAFENELTTIHLEGSSIDHLDLHHNRLRSIDLETNNNLRYLDLAFNELATVPDLSGQTQLETLLLEQNSVWDTQEFVDNPAVGTVELNLEKNRLLHEQCDNLQVLLDRAFLHGASFTYNDQGGPGLLLPSHWPTFDVQFMIDDMTYELNCW